METNGTYHAVTQGECLSSIAQLYGFSNYRIIYNHPNNLELKRKRPNPNILLPGDELFIPYKECYGFDRQTEKRHKFVVKKPKVMLRIVVKDEDDRPFANMRYKIKVSNKEYEGTTDGDGKIEKEIPADSTDGALMIFQEQNGKQQVLGVFALQLGSLDPVEEITGTQSRLNNLGFGCGEVDGIIGEKTEGALRAFQKKNGLPVTGKADPATLDKLRQLHDWQ